MGHIFLYGPPGTGKTTIGEALARNLKLPFVDLDRVVETKAGRSILQLMEQDGEAAFRDLESSALQALANEVDSVVALGGGALLRNENRSFAESKGKVIFLAAELSTLLERLNSDPGKRPLLNGDLCAKLTALLTKRGEHYHSFPLSVHVDGKTAEQNVHGVQILMGRHHLSAMGEYDVLVQDGGIDQLGNMLKSRGLKSPIVVTDENVAEFHAGKMMDSLHASGFDAKVMVVPAGEGHKNLDTVSGMWRSFLEHGLDRKGTVVALGGGVVGDMAGFAASTFMRGIAWVAVPTSLLSMVDASLGGKTGFDLQEGKNLIGSFYPPKLVLADPRLLKTLPERELISGMAEVVKHGMISDPDLFDLCTRGFDWIKGHLEEIVKRAMAVKIKVIEQDPFEKDVRATLNLGHTVGHAVELVSNFDLRHGEAVAIGMVAEAKYSARVGLAIGGLVDALTESLLALKLPVQIPDALPREELLRAMQVDKKRNAKTIRFALPVEVGKVELVDVADLESVLE